MARKDFILGLVLCLCLTACTSVEPPGDEGATTERMGEFELIQIAGGKHMPSPETKEAVDACGC